MKKILYLVIIFIFCGVLSGYAQNLILVEVSADLSSAVIRDSDTGNQWRVATGDKIDGWIVREIARSHVHILKRGQEGELDQMTKLRASEEVEIRKIGRASCRERV